MRLLNSALLALGIAASGWFVGNGIITFRTMDQVVDVRGLDERIVMANEGSIDLRYVVSAGNLKELSSQIEASQRSLEEFLATQGFSGTAVQKVSVTISDNLQNRSSNDPGLYARYTARAGALVFSSDVNRIQALAQKTDQLIARGVALESTMPRFSFTDLNSLKPKMLVAATQGAREAAESFARDSGAKLGGIKSASQGLFTITSPNSDYDDVSSLQKRVRVVTRVSYYMH